MRYSALYIAPFVAAAYAQSSSESVTVVPEISGSVTISSTYIYSNTETNFLTLTNSAGVITGMPTLPAAPTGVTTQPAVVTEQPAVATIPAGLPSGLHTIFIGNTSSFTASVGGTTTTVVLNGDATTSAVIVTGSAATTAPSGSSGSAASNGSPSSSGSGSPTSGSAQSTSSPGAAANLKIATGSVLGLGAIFAALL